MDAPTQVYIRAYHNSESRFLEYEPGQRIVPVFETYEPDADHDQLCSRMYELLNIGDDPSFGQPDPRAIEYRARRNRSLSVGDVIQIGKEGDETPKFYAVSMSGFDSIATPTHVVNVGRGGTTPLA